MWNWQIENLSPLSDGLYAKVEALAKRVAAGEATLSSVLGGIQYAGLEIEGCAYRKVGAATVLSFRAQGQEVMITFCFACPGCYEDTRGMWGDDESGYACPECGVP